MPNWGSSMHQIYWMCGTLLCAIVIVLSCFNAFLSHADEEERSDRVTFWSCVVALSALTAMFACLYGWLCSWGLL